MTDPTPPIPAPRHGRIVRVVEQAILGSRWVLAPIYLGLSVSLLLLLAKFVQHTVSLVIDVPHEGEEALIVGVLTLVDISLTANLVLIVMFAGYENFVSRFGALAARARPTWMDGIGISEIKIKLLTSVVAISAIHVLEDFMHIGEVSDRELGWSVGIHLAFVVSGVLLALMDRLHDERH